MKATDISARLLYAWEKFMCKQAEKIIVLMPMAKQYYISRGIDVSKIYWIPNGVDLERYKNHVALESDTEIGRIIEKYREKFKVVYTGAHGQANGLDVAIDAAAVLVSEAPDVHFILIGDGPSKQLLKEKAELLGCTNVTFCEPVPKVSIPKILKNTDLLTLCIRPMDIYKYGISLNKLNDYLAIGRPIIISADIANDIITEAQAGLTVIPSDPEALAEGILKIFHMSKEERERLGVNGRAYVEKHHNISTLGEALARLL
jgi:glycosyltransferase involved in cell wall biosynthesis